MLGVDEAGRGPLAGPVSVGVVAVPEGFDVAKEFPGVTDSKKLSEKKREKFFEMLETRVALGDMRFAVEFESAEVIDREGIVPAVRRALALEPGLRVDGLRAAGLYADCQMDDARLCLLNVLQAIQFGALCANYLRVETLFKTHERVCGAVTTDVFTGGSIEIQADVVINATGPWSDRVRRLSDTAAERRLAPTKGVHLILPRLAQEPLFAQARDRRMIFLLP